MACERVRYIRTTSYSDWVRSTGNRARSADAILPSPDTEARWEGVIRRIPCTYCGVIVAFAALARRLRCGRKEEKKMKTENMLKELR
jgi:hypothetical protein